MASALSNSIQLLKELKSQLSNPRSIPQDLEYTSERTNPATSAYSSKAKKEQKVGKIQQNKRLKGTDNFYFPSQLHKNKSYEHLLQQPDKGDCRSFDETGKLLNKLKQAITMHQREHDQRVQEMIRSRQEQLRLLQQDCKRSKFAKAFAVIDSISLQ